MKLEEFLKEVRGLKNKGYLPYIMNIYGGRLRFDNIKTGTHCPITAVCEVKTGQTHGICGVNKAGKLLQLEEEIYFALVDAADYRETEHTKLRKELIEAMYS